MAYDIIEYNGISWEHTGYIYIYIYYVCIYSDISGIKRNIMGFEGVWLEGCPNLDPAWELLIFWVNTW